MSYTKTFQFTAADGKTPLDVNVYYGNDFDETAPHPAIIWYFGGGWGHGSIAGLQSYGNYFSTKGFVVVTPSYRTYESHGVLPDACVKDAKRGVQWAYDHAAELGIDRDKIVFAGGSAGGHLAACCAMLGKTDEEDIDVTAVPKAMMLMNAVLDTTPDGFWRERNNAVDMTKLSPVHMVKPGIVPTVLFHGTADRTVGYRQSAIFCGRMNESGNVAELYSYHGKGHSFSMMKNDLYAFADVMSKGEAFLKRQLGMEE